MKIILVDDHPVFRSGMATILTDIFDHSEIIEAGDAHALDAALSHSAEPDLVVVDLFFPGFDYKKDLAKLRRRLALTPIIVISMLNDQMEIEAVISNGINGYISKAVSPEQIIAAVEEVMRGEVVVRKSDGILTHKEDDEFTQLEKLTPRQLEILRFLCAGLSNKEIAGELQLSPFTVRSHVSALLKTLGVSNRSAASALAAGRGLAAK